MVKAISIKVNTCKNQKQNKLAIILENPSGNNKTVIITVITSIMTLLSINRNKQMFTFLFNLGNLTIMGGHS